MKKASFNIRLIFFVFFSEFICLSKFLRDSSLSGQLSGGAPELAEMKKASFDYPMARNIFCCFLRIFQSKPISKASLSRRPAHRRRARACRSEESIVRVFFAAFLEFFCPSQILRLPSPSVQLSGGAPELAEVKKASFDIRIFFAAVLELFSLSQFLRLPSPAGQLSGGAPELAEVKKASFDYPNIFLLLS